VNGVNVNVPLIIVRLRLIGLKGTETSVITAWW